MGFILVLVKIKYLNIIFPFLCKLLAMVIGATLVEVWVFAERKLSAIGNDNDAFILHNVFHN